jgi:hypothetical protein
VSVGHTKSCGCIYLETVTIRNLKHGQAYRGNKSKEYKAWCNIKRRCYDKNVLDYKNYGGRGITVCDEWRDDFSAFYNHIGPAPARHLSVDRINNNGNYEPGNVRWATNHEQRINSRNCKLTIEQVQAIRTTGKGKPIRALMEEYGVSSSTIDKIRANEVWKEELC